MRYVGDTCSHDSSGRTGILLVNLGTPDEPTPRAVRRYLKEFLWDPRVVEIPRPVWWLLLHTLVLPLRPRRVATAYRSVWLEDGAPLRVHSEDQREALERMLAPRLPGVAIVALGMRYGRPSIADALAKLRAAHVEQLLVLPLYPQYCSATTGSAFDAVSAVLRRWRSVPALRFVHSYHAEPRFIAALAQSVREHRDGDPVADRLLFSFHGIPKRTAHAGDPYYEQCLETARLTAEALALPPEQWASSFQSRFGRAEWLQPYTTDVLLEWAHAGVRRVDVICPGFSADCLETLEEIAIRARETFEEAGGESLRYIPALNARADHIEFLADLAGRNLQPWTGTAAPEPLAASRRRDNAIGSLHRRG